MNTPTVIIKFGNEKHCFLLLEYSSLRVSRQTVTTSNGPVVYEAEISSGQKAYFTVFGNGGELASGDTVEINKEYAKKLGFKDCVEFPLPLKPLGQVPFAKRVLVEPFSSNDWEIIVSQSSRVENQILNQIRVVWPGQLLPVWTTKNVSVTLKINVVEPEASCVLLEQNTEIVINPKSRVVSPPSTLAWTVENSAAQPHLTHWGSLDKGLDTLEPKPIQSPIKSLVSFTKRTEVHRQRNISNPEHRTSGHPMSRQSSVMSWMRSLFKPADLEEAAPDSGPGIDFSQIKQPTRSGVLRVQPMKTRHRLDQSFPVNKSAINKQIVSRLSLKDKLKGDQVPESNFNVPYELFQPSTVYVDAESSKTERLLHPYLPYLPQVFIARMRKLPSPAEKMAKFAKAAGPTANSGQGDNPVVVNSSVDGSAHNVECCYVRVVAIDRKAGLTDRLWQNAADEVLSQQPLLFGHLIIPDLLRSQLKLEATSLVWLKTGPFEPVVPKKVTIFSMKSSRPADLTLGTLKASFIHYIKQCADEAHPLVVFQGLFLKFMTFKGVPLEVQLTFSGDSPPTLEDVTLLSEANIDSVLLTVEMDIKADKLGVIKDIAPSLPLDPKPLTNKLTDLGGVDEIAAQAIASIHASLGVRPLSQHNFLPHVGLCHGFLLVTGPSGCGKTSVIKAIAAKMSELPVLARVNYMDCKTYRGIPLGSLKKTLESMFDEAAWHEPSLILLDNLDSLVSASSGPEAEMSLENLYAMKISQILQGLIKYETDNNSRVMVIATSKSRSNIHPSLASNRGTHYIQKIMDIGSPNKATRELILRALLKSHLGLSEKTSESLDISSIVSRTEGYVARDLEILVTMAIHNRLMKDREVSKDGICLTYNDFDDPLHTFKPVSIRHIELHKPGELGWSNVGGLADVKKALVETLKWPTKYPELYNACPLRMRSGILLYGAPGTGKTLLAGVVAKECELNFISIKGPELLNKYIGASEQAVRELFTRAQNAKPCILFFDEFDSIAPKRGHDNTGVTDRVVNQLLTQLDGVEGLQGVFVLAATSRPDLIDPALLRPGRLDRSILCEMPNKDERHEILRALSCKMSLAEDVNLAEIAELSENFTGADLKALLYNAQLKAIHEYTDDQDMGPAIRLQSSGEMCSCNSRDDSKPKLKFPNSRSGSFNDSPFTPSTPKNKVVDSPRSCSATHFPFNEEEVAADDLSTMNVRVSQSLESSLQALENSQPLNDTAVFFIGETDSQTTCLSFNDDKVLAETELSDLNVRVSKSLRSNSQAVDTKPHKEAAASTGETDSQTTDLSFNDDKVSAETELIDLNVRVSKSLRSNSQAVDTKPHKETAASTGETDSQTTDLSFNDDKVAAETEIIDLNVRVSKSLRSNSQAVDSKPHKETVATTGETDSQTVKREKAKVYVQSSGREKRKRHFARENKLESSIEEKSAAKDVPSEPVGNPVTVFTSLERGLATLSPEDEARYLAMVKEIQSRDKYLFLAANDKRRTSLQLAYRPSSLLEVNQKHLQESVKAMRPSVSASERERYCQIYQSFMSSKIQQYEKPELPSTGSRATLA